MSRIKVNDQPLIYLHPNLLTSDECWHFQQLPLFFKKSKAIWYDENNNQVSHHDGRTSETAYAKDFIEEKQLRIKISNEFNIDINTIEPLQFTRYSNNQEYQAHHDYFKEGSLLSNNRIYTLIIYLNDNYGGGETEFPLLNKTIIPKSGMGLFFKYDYNIVGLNELTLHAGLPVTSGVKNIITAWVREKAIEDLI